MKAVVPFFMAVAMFMGFNACKSSKSVTEQNSDVGITGKYWKLIEVRGVAVTELGATNNEPHIVLNTDNSFVGSGGCNSIGGAFEINEPFRIKFSQAIATLMACPDMEVESALLKIIQDVDNYTVSEDGKTLSLNKARMTPLARFELVEK